MLLIVNLIDRKDKIEKDINDKKIKDRIHILDESLIP
jgi:hypothetical protein